MTVQVAAKCKFCGKNLVLSIDKTYFDLRDPYGLIKLASCGRCAHLKVQQRNLTDGLSDLSGKLLIVRDQAVKGKFTETARNYLRGYLHFLSQWHKIPEIAWDEAILDSFVGAPREVGSVINKMWAMAKEIQKQGELALPAKPEDLENQSDRLPYKD